MPSSLSPPHCQHVQWFSAQNGQHLPTQPPWQSTVAILKDIDLPSPVHTGFGALGSSLPACPAHTWVASPGLGPQNLSRCPTTHYCIIQQLFECQSCASYWGPSKTAGAVSSWNLCPSLGSNQRELHEQTRDALSPVPPTSSGSSQTALGLTTKPARAERSGVQD